MSPICYEPIGIIHSPFIRIEGMPIQRSAATGQRGQVVLNEEYAEGLDDLDGFSHIYLLYHFHRSKSYRLKVIPFLDDKPRGLFATRAPSRPNAIGLSLVKLVHIDRNILEIENVDVLDGTPLLDIKPYVPGMEGIGECEIGWMAKHTVDITSKRSDGRFK